MWSQITINHAPPSNDYCSSSVARVLFAPNRNRSRTNRVLFLQRSSTEEKAMSTIAHGELDDTQRRLILVRAVIPSTIVPSIEWSDLFLYTIATVMVFS